MSQEKPGVRDSLGAMQQTVRITSDRVEHWNSIFDAWLAFLVANKLVDKTTTVLKLTLNPQPQTLSPIP